jgi:crossover junction endodeoxyribonuclease RuvC
MAESYRVLGVDPGSRVTGFGLIEVSGRRLTHVSSGALSARSSLSLERRLLSIFEGLTRIIREHDPGVLCVEDVFYAQNVRSAITLGHARGAVLVAACRAGLPVRTYSPAEIKMTVAGSGRAEKAQVQQMVRAILSLPDLPGPDAADALAAAICHAQQAAMRARIAPAARPQSRRVASRPTGVIP